MKDKQRAIGPKWTHTVEQDLVTYSDANGNVTERLMWAAVDDCGGILSWHETPEGAYERLAFLAAKGY